MNGQKLILDGTVTFDGLRTIADGGTDTDDTMSNTTHLVFVEGELEMKGGKITGNYNTNNDTNGGQSPGGNILSGGGIGTTNDILSAVGP